MIGRIEEHMIYFPERAIEVLPAEAGLRYEEVFIKTEDEVQIHGWWIPADEARLTILCFHGNAGNISHRIDRMTFFHDRGLDVFMIDYRGYGRSDGRPSEEGLYRDGRAAYEYLRESRGISPDRIVIFGKSLGGAVAADLATRVEAGGLILESTFTSIKDMARLAVPVLPVHLLVRTRFDSLEKVPEIRIPILVVHGKQDSIVPFEHGQRLYDAAQGTKELLPIPRADHNDVLFKGGSIYRDGLRAFLDRLP